MATITEGLLYITMQPNDNITLAQFQDWYNNEHGPTRLRLPFIKNGIRYRAMDLDSTGKDSPEWLAIYDIADMNELTKDTYTRLRTDAVKTEREKNVMKEIAVDRKLFDLVTEKHATDFKSPDSIDAGGNVVLVTAAETYEGREDELKEWFSKEHNEMISKIPGWRRSRLFLTSPLLEGLRIEYLKIHEFAPENGIGGPDFQAAVSSPWAKRISEEVVKKKSSRQFNLYYIFGPAPRDLESVSDSSTSEFSSRDGLTKTLPIGQKEYAAIESYVTTLDGAFLPYRLEGSKDPNAPTIILSNSVLVKWGIWDDFVDAFLSNEDSRKYRVLRYHTRGRTGKVGKEPITLDTLSTDIMTLMDALRISKAAALVGVSLGGATVLNTALKYPERVGSFVSCDTNAKSPDGNKKTWGERIAIAEEQNMRDIDGKTIVGSKLAEMTTRRWFVDESYDGGELEKKLYRVQDMVESNDFEGFKKGVEALFAYDIVDGMKRSKIPAAFVVGTEDGVLPKTMKTMAEDYGGGIGIFRSIEGAGHLPMVEKPGVVADFVTEFLQRLG